MIVQKYGGSSVKNAERIKNVVSIIKSTYENRDKKLIVVLSAVGGITDMLIDASKSENWKEMYDEAVERHKQICDDLGIDYCMIEKLLEEIPQYIDGKEVDKKTLDIIQSFGERLSTRIMSAYLNKIGIKSTQHDAFDIGFVTDSNHCNAEIFPETYDNIKKSFEGFEGIPIVTGFIAKNKAGDITTLGRGGSDYTAAIIGAAMDADAVEIWTDVNGIMTADPRMISDAKTVPMVSFAEASELAFFGVKVLHPKTILPVMDKNIPVRILNTYEPDNPGTSIVNELPKDQLRPHKAIAFKRQIQLINVTSQRMLAAYGFLAKLFEVFKKHKVSVDMVATSEISVSMTVDPSADLTELVKELEEFSKVKVEQDKSLICVVGETTNDTPGEMAKVTGILGEENINIEMMSQGASEINIAFVVNSDKLEQAVKALHSRLL